MLNNSSILFIYLPFAILYILSVIYGRTQSTSKIVNLQEISLVPGIITGGIYISGIIIQSLWYYLPILNLFKYNVTSWTVFSILHVSYVILIARAILRHKYGLSLRQAFNLRIETLLFVTKLCIFLAVIRIFFAYILGINYFKVSPNSDILESVNITNIVLLFISSGVINPFAEELIYRGLLYYPVCGKNGKYFASILTSFVWAYSHFVSFKQSFLLFIFGLFLCWLNNRERSLFPSILFHIFWNSYVIIGGSISAL